MNLRSNADWEVDLEGVVRGSTTTYGVGGLLGSFEVFAPGIAMLTQPLNCNPWSVRCPSKKAPLEPALVGIGR